MKVGSIPEAGTAAPRKRSAIKVSRSRAKDSACRIRGPITQDGGG